MSKPAKNVIQVDFADELEDNYLRYALPVIAGRAIPSRMDGLIPAQRRLLWYMMEHGIKYGTKSWKSAKITGATAGDYHPHADAYGSLVGMTAPYVSLPLVEAHGSFGSIFGESASAARYTEATLSRAGELAMDGVKEGILSMQGNYDDTLTEPIYLQTRFPNLLISGRLTGIAVGYSCTYTEHNPGEVMDLAIHMSKMKNPESISFEEIRRYMPGPDFKSGGTVIGVDGIRDYYMTGVGTIRIQGKVEVEELPRGKTKIHVKELPYGVSHEAFVDSVKKSREKETALEPIVELKNLTGKKGLHIELTLRKGANVQAVLAGLYAKTNLESTFSVRMYGVGLDGVPEMQTVPMIVTRFLELRRKAIAAKTTVLLEKKDKDAHHLAGLIKVLVDVDKAIEIIRGSKDELVARKSLMAHFKIDEKQADYVLSLQLRRLTQADRLELQKKKEALGKEIDNLNAILSDPKAAQKELLRELKETRDIIARERYVTIIDKDIDEHKKAQQEALVKATKTPAAQSVAFVPGTGLKVASAKDNHVFPQGAELWSVESNGVVHKVDSLAVTTRASWDVNEDRTKPKAPTVFARGSEVIVFTKNASVKIVDTETLPKTQGTSDVIPEGADAFVVLPHVKDYAIMVTDSGKILKIDLSKVRAQGRTGSGVAGMNIGDSRLVSAFEANDDDVLITVTNDSVKLTPVSDIPVKGRGTGGVVVHNFRKGDKALLGAYIQGDEWGRLAQPAIPGYDYSTELPKPSARGKTGRVRQSPTLI